MATPNVLGIIYSNVYDDCLSELTSVRTMGSVPFAGRYRLIDFVLSGMVNGKILNKEILEFACKKTHADIIVALK